MRITFLRHRCDAHSPVERPRGNADFSLLEDDIVSLLVVLRPERESLQIRTGNFILKETQTRQDGGPSP